jgi:hypothetical protein
LVGQFINISPVGIIIELVARESVLAKMSDGPAPATASASTKPSVLIIGGLGMHVSLNIIIFTQVLLEPYQTPLPLLKLIYK